MQFSVVLQPPSEDRYPDNAAYLIRDNWDDNFRFATLFSLVVIANGERVDAGAVKIGQFGLAGSRSFEPDRRSPQLPTIFDSLDDRFFSLGQDENYYETLYQLGQAFAHSVLGALRDCAYDLELFGKAEREPVMQMSLLRSVSASTVRGRFARLARGDAQLTPFNFGYVLPAYAPDMAAPRLHFEIQPESHPPTNVHAIIGRNGAGKTRCFNLMCRAILEGFDREQVGLFEHDFELHSELFANLVSVSFSAFDPFLLSPELILQHSDHPEDAISSRAGVRFSYIGLKDFNAFPEHTPKSPESLGDEFVRSVSKCSSSARVDRWRAALRTLESDPLFAECGVSDFTQPGADTADSTVRQIWNGLSAGHKIVLLTITRLVELVDERTLVLLDEPESHLHPPLLAAFVRALSDLLVKRNGVAIIATHSPVVLQEVPRSCVWILSRSGSIARAARPSVETFGENVGTLTREVFGLEVTNSGYHKLLEQAVERVRTYENVIELFGDQLGIEARAIAKGLAPDPEF